MTLLRKPQDRHAWCQIEDYRPKAFGKPALADKVLAGEASLGESGTLRPQEVLRLTRELQVGLAALAVVQLLSQSRDSPSLS